MIRADPTGFPEAAPPLPYAETSGKRRIVGLLRESNGSLPGGDLADGPLGVLADEGFGIASGDIEGGDVLWRADVTQCDADISEETAALDALNWGFAEKPAEIVPGQGE